MNGEHIEDTPKEEAKRRIEVAFASGNFSTCYCYVCGDETPVDVYRVRGRPMVFCDRHVPEIAIAPDEYHSNQ